MTHKLEPDYTHIVGRCSVNTKNAETALGSALRTKNTCVAFYYLSSQADSSSACFDTLVNVN